MGWVSRRPQAARGATIGRSGAKLGLLACIVERQDEKEETPRVCGCGEGGSKGGRAR